MTSSIADPSPERLPLLRWAGGKRRLVPRLLEFTPPSFNTYYEPMFGSGALFFAVAPRRAVLADINDDLINFYTVLHENPLRLAHKLNRLKATKLQYYRLRARCPKSPLARAVRFYYLSRLAWNGIHRVNRRGHFNVPFGGRRPAVLLNERAALAASFALGTARLMSGDFQVTTQGVQAGDFVYFDPPYPKGAAEGNGFERYHQTRFGLEDHRRLARHAQQLAREGAFVMISEAARSEILDMYPRDFHASRIRSQSLIAADRSSRRYVFELVVTSYKPQLLGDR